MGEHGGVAAQGLEVGPARRIELSLQLRLVLALLLDEVL